MMRCPQVVVRAVFFAVLFISSHVANGRRLSPGARKGTPRNHAKTEDGKQLSPSHSDEDSTSGLQQVATEVNQSLFIHQQKYNSTPWFSDYSCTDPAAMCGSEWGADNDDYQCGACEKRSCAKKKVNKCKENGKPMYRKKCSCIQSEEMRQVTWYGIKSTETMPCHFTTWFKCKISGTHDGCNKAGDCGTCSDHRSFWNYGMGIKPDKNNGGRDKDKDGFENHKSCSTGVSAGSQANAKAAGYITCKCNKIETEDCEQLFMDDQCTEVA